MAELKTKATSLSVKDYLDGIEDETRRKDCKALAALMKRVTQCTPKMWGASMVGFDRYHYKYDSGHEGDMFVVGFSSRKGDISVYLTAGFDDDLLAALGKHKVGKSCLYIKSLKNIELAVLEQLVVRSVAETKRRYPEVSH